MLLMRERFYTDAGHAKGNLRLASFATTTATAPDATQSRTTAPKMTSALLMAIKAKTGENPLPLQTLPRTAGAAEAS